MRISIHHTTLYRYETALLRSTQLIRLTPRTNARQSIVSWQVLLPQSAETYSDAFGNFSHLLSLQSSERPVKAISITAQGVVDVDDTDAVTNARTGQKAVELIAPKVYLRTTPLTMPDDAILEFINPLRPLIQLRPHSGLTDLMYAILDRMPYQSGTTTVTHTASQSFAQRSGVCQDHAQVFIACCRALGIPARYVSGYVYSANQEEVASHAWVHAWLTNRWASFDVSNVHEVADLHVELAVGMDYLDACPVRGMRVGGDEEIMDTRAQVRLVAPQ